MKLGKLCMIVGLALGTSAFGSAEEIKITKVVGSGSACHVDDSGKPTDFSVSINNATKSIRVNFDDFLIDEKDETKKKSCKLKIFVDFPEGSTIYAYNTGVAGVAETSNWEITKIRTQMTLPNKRFPAANPYVISGGHDGRWESDIKSYKGKQIAPCGGKNFQLTYNIILDLKGKDSFAQITHAESKFGNLKYKIEKCK